MRSLLLYLIMALLLLPLCTAQSSVSRTVDFHVGVILDFDSPVGRIGNSCLWLAHSDFYSVHGDYKTRLLLHPINSNESVVDAAAAALDLLRDVKVDAIIGPQTSGQVNFVMDLGDRAHVPIISFSATSPPLIRRTPYFVQTAHSDANQVQAIASIIEAFKWSQVMIIFEDSEFGSGIIPYLSNALQDVKARVSYKSVLPRTASDDFISKELQKMMTMETRVFVVHVSQFLGTKLFLKVRELGMMTEGYVWIVTSGLTELFNLLNSDVVEAMQGVLGVRHLIPKSKELQSFAARWTRELLQANQYVKPAETSIFGLWAYDTFWALAMAAENVGNSRSSVTENEANVGSTSPFILGVSETGPKLLQALLETKFTGLAGEFNLVNGQLDQTAYQIVNVVESMEWPVGTWTPSGGISGTRNLNVTSFYSTSKENFRSIIWPGDSTIAPRGWEVPLNGKKLRIAVPKPALDKFVKVKRDPVTNGTSITGFYVDVFSVVVETLPYAIPYEYIPYSFLNPDGSRGRSYNDLVYNVSLQKDFDVALGDITATANRSLYADFIMPYPEGVACIGPTKYEDVNDIFTFLQPLTTELWLTTAIFYISTALVIWILAKRIVQRSRDLPGQHAGMVCNFPFFPGQGIEANLVCVILVTWAFVASLLNSTYTASLSSKLTVARLQTTFTPKDGDYIGCPVDSFLVRDSLKLIFDASRVKTYNSVEDFYKALSLGSKNGGISAYFDVLPSIRLILSMSCGMYMMVGPIHRTETFAFAFPKGSPLVADITRAIVKLTENPTIPDIEQRGLLSKPDCPGPDSSSSPIRVPLRSFSVLFAVTGFVTVTCLVVSLLIHKHERRIFLQRISGFKASACSKFLAFRKYLKRNDSSSLPRTTNSGAEIQVAETGSSS